MDNVKQTVLHILASGEIGGIEILCRSYAKYSRHNNIFLFPWHTGIITDEMEKEGNQVIRLGATQKDILTTYFKIKKICFNYQVTCIVIHHNAPALLLYIPFFKKSISEITVYMYAHSAAEDMFWKSNLRKYLYYKPIVSWASKHVDGIIAISEFVKATVMDKMQIAEEKITVVYNGIEINKFSSNQKNSGNSPALKQGRKIIFVGRLIEEKGVQIILNALATLQENFHFDVVGDGPFRNQLEQKVKELGIDKKVSFWGSRRDVQSFLNRADIFVHVPIWEEGFGLTVVEAMAMGLICICSRSGAIPEIIQDGNNGFLVEKNNEKALSIKLEEVMRSYDSEMVTLIQMNSIETAKKYSIQEYAKNIDNIFDGITSYIVDG